MFFNKSKFLIELLVVQLIFDTVIHAKVVPKERNKETVFDNNNTTIMIKLYEEEKHEHPALSLFSKLSPFRIFKLIEEVLFKEKVKTHSIEKRNIVAVNVVRKQIITNAFGYTAATSGGKIRNIFQHVYNQIKNFILNDGNSTVLDESNMTITATTTTIKPEYEQFKLKTNFTNILKKRSSRAIPAFAKSAGKFGGWGAAMLAISAASSIIDTYIKSANEEKLMELVRKKFDCKKNNYGCIQNVCWSNCGPRIGSADWCITTKDNKTATIETSEIEENNALTLKFNPVECEKDVECDPCWVCGASCKIEN